MSATLQRAPDLTYQQRIEHLEKANHVRHERAMLKRDLKARRKTLARVLLDPPSWLLSMKVFDLLVATPKVGRVRANKALTRLEISPSRTVGGLSPRQRHKLITSLQGGGHGH